jgi:hypothetical protein
MRGGKITLEMLDHRLRGVALEKFTFRFRRGMQSVNAIPDHRNRNSTTEREQYGKKP